ncbi:MAG: hypothetical protein WB809_07925, partial [Thermoplasmata archaeon]
MGRIATDYARQAQALDELRIRSDAEVKDQIAALEARLARARALDWSRLPPTDLLDDLSHALLLPDASWNRPPAPPGIGARIRAFFARLVAWLRSLFSRKRARTSSPASEGRTVTFAIPDPSG